MAIRRRFRGARFLRWAVRGDHRRELRNLLAAQTDSLLRIKHKGNAGHVLSRAEWIVATHFAQHGIEAFPLTLSSDSSRGSFIAVLDAFAAVYDLRTRATGRDAYYLGNLPLECRPGSTRGERDDAPTAEAVRQTVAETRRRLGEGPVLFFPWLAGRNLAVLLADEPLPRGTAIHHALRPHWPALWPLVVRGHDALTGEALPDVPPARDACTADDRGL